MIALGFEEVDPPAVFRLRYLALIAAVAQSNGLVMATRNTKHFEPLGVQLLNPWT